MTLTGPDETDLLLPLLNGSAEPRPFSTFLSRLQRRCGAVYASLHVRVGPLDLISYWTGPNLMERARETGMDELAELDRIQYDLLRPGRVYAPQEYFDSDPVRRSWRMQHMARLGVADERAIRVLAEPEISAWLVIAAKQSFGAGESALLSSLAPYVAATVRNTAMQHRARATETLAEASLARAGIGWIAFDREGAITALAERTRETLASLLGFAVQVGDRASMLSRSIEAEVMAGVARFARDPDAAPLAALLSDRPRIDALLFPPGDLSGEMVETPAIIALLRLPHAADPARVAGLAQLFDLKRREAELAIALYDGFSLAEAADKLGLTLETTRNYSKKLYSKLGVRGQTELVRKVAQSSAVLV